jgi:hypothetical protein
LHSNVEPGIVAENANDGDVSFVGADGPSVIDVSGAGAGVGLAVAVGDGVAVAVGVGVAVAVGVAVGVGVAVAVGVGVAVAVGVGVGVAIGSTTTVPVMKAWASQTNVYVPAAVKVQYPSHPGGCEKPGTGGASLASRNGTCGDALVCGQNVGAGADLKLTLCWFVPDGKSNVTRSLTLIVTLLSAGLDDDASWNQALVGLVSWALMRGPGGGVGVAVAVAVGVAVAVAVGVAVGVAVDEGVGVGVAVPEVTTTVPSIPACSWQKKSYVPAVLNVQYPSQPGGRAFSGIGGTPFESSPGACGDSTVWLHTEGLESSAKSTLWEAEFVSLLSGDLNVTVPPTAISTERSLTPPDVSWK